MNKLTLAIAAASIGVTAMAAPALAEAPTKESKSIVIADLNLETPQGQKALERRIRQAARKVCGIDDQTTGTRIRSQDAQRCYAKALTSAERQVAAIRENTRAGG